MLRTLTLTLMAALIPTTALACGMYLPPESGSLDLAKMLEAVDDADPTVDEIALAEVAVNEEVVAAVEPVTPKPTPLVAAVDDEAPAKTRKAKRQERRSESAS